MAISLAGITLPSQTQWLEEIEQDQVRQDYALTLGGAPVLWSQQLAGLEIITLEISRPNAWLEWSAVSALLPLYRAAGQQMTLSWNGTVYTVMFAHHAKPAMSVRPVHNYSVRASDVFELTIKLVEV